MPVLDELQGLVTNKLGEMKSFYALLKLEAKLAGLSVFPLILNVCLLFVILLSFWITSMCMLGYGVMIAYNNLFIALSAVFLTHVVFFALLLFYLNFNIKKMSFEKTRHYLRTRI